MRARRVMGAALGVLGLMAGAIGGFGMVADSESASAASGSSVQVAEELLPVFGVEQSARDDLRSEIIEVAGIAPQTSRLLGQAHDVQFWAAATPGGDICLIAQLPNGEHALPGDDPVTGTTCTPAAAFGAQGTDISVDGYTAAHGVMAYLLPASATDSSVRAAADQLGNEGDVLVSRDGTHLLAVTPDAADRARGITITTIHGDSFTLAPLARCGPGCG